MFQEEQIVKLFAPIAKKLRDAGKNVKNILDEKDKKKLINFYPIYKEAVQAADDIRVHTEVGVFPESLFKEKAPNQTKDELKYIKGNYKEITLTVTEDFFSVLNRIWNPNNWSITYAKDDNSFKNQPAQEYFQEIYPTYGSLTSYFRSLATPSKEKDANSVMVFRPKEIPFKDVQRGGETVSVVDDSILVDPIAKIIPVRKVISWKEESHVLILTPRKVKVKVGGKDKEEGLVFEFYDDENLWVIQQRGEKKDMLFDFIRIFNHNLGFVPAIKMKGTPLERDDEVLYQSPLTSAIKPLDQAILDNSSLSIAKVTIAYPRRWEMAAECEFKDSDGQPCVEGNLWVKGEQTTCPNCKGTGTKTLNELLSVRQIKEPRRGDAEEFKMPLPPFGRETVNTDSLKFIRDEIELNLDKGREMLNKTKSTTDVKGSETALGKQIDREEQFTFILGISNELFDIYAFANKAIGGMRYGDKFEQPDISPPTHFVIRTLEEVTLELSNAIKTNLPQIVVRNLILEYIDIRFGTQPKKIKQDQIVLFADRLATFSETQVSFKKAGGSASNIEVILHTSAYNFIAEALIDDKDFLNKELPEQKQVLVDKATEVDAQITAAAGSAQAEVEAATGA